ncbi:type II toxin-antitoxin system Phd/YefM family antitoxin [Tomitella gaofuii]|nr:type II toxin-antitoxin system Phd/YefM family antitoxin [Tomitella gaofuii]
MRSISSTDAKARLNAVLAEVEQAGVPVMITNRGRAVPGGRSAA